VAVGLSANFPLKFTSIKTHKRKTKTKQKIFSRVLTGTLLGYNNLGKKAVVSY